jgi:DNA invertase Pin-like site-specific DNA recombinase
MGKAPAAEACGLFEDREAGKHLDRPAFQRLQAAIFAGSIDTVIVWKLDRLARSLKDGVNVLADWCQRGIRVVSVTQQIHLSGPVGQMIAGVLFGVAAIELQHSKERQAIGIAGAKEARRLYRTQGRHHEGAARAGAGATQAGP